MTLQLVVIVLVFLIMILDASININTLPPDFRRLSEGIPAVSRINPAWTGDHSAALDGEQNKVLVSWSVIGDQVEFQVCHGQSLDIKLEIK